MIRPHAPPPAIITVSMLAGLAVVAFLVIAGLVVPISVRHAAPFGSVQTVDFNRSIAVLGGQVRPNYPNFDRVGLDLRAYSVPAPDDRYDFVLTVQSLDRPEVVRRVGFSVPRDRIAASRSAFSDTYLPVAFERIPDSAGETFYVSIERGPRNADDVVTLWGIQSFSTLRAADVLLAAVDGYRIGFAPATDRAILLSLMALTLVGSGVTTAATLTASWAGRSRGRSATVRRDDGF